MKNNKIAIIGSARKLLLLIGLGLAAFGAKATILPQMSGTVTINSGAAASATNFQNWYSFWRSLQGLSRTDYADTFTAGISAALTVNVITDVFESTSVVFPAITGMSSTRTITINGNGKSLIYTGTLEAISFTGGDFFTIKNLVISDTNTTTSVIGIRFSNNSNSNTIDGCTIEFTKSVTVPTAATSAYIAFSASATSLTATSTVTSGSFNTISNCIMRTKGTNAPGPYIGICVMGNSTTATQQTVATNNTITNNTIGNFYFYGIYQTGSNGNQITNNDISRSSATQSSPISATMHAINSTGNYGTNRSTMFNGNKIHDLPYVGATAVITNPVTTFYGMLLSTNTASATYDMQVKNNEYYNINVQGTFYGLSVPTSSYLTVFGNKVKDIANYGTTAPIYGFNITTGTKLSATYNSFSNINSAYYSYGMSATTAVDAIIAYNTFADIKTVGYSYGIIANSSKTSTIDNNKFENVAVSGTGYAYGIQATSCTSVTFSNNLTDNVTTINGYLYGIQANTGTTNTLTKNTMQNSSTTGSGNIYCYQMQNCISNVVSFNQVLNNSVYSSGDIYGFDMAISTTGINNNIITGNVVDGNAIRGTTATYIYAFDFDAAATSYLPRNWEITNNIVNNSYSTSTTNTNYLYGFYAYYLQDFTFTGNSVTNCKNGYVSAGYVYSFYIYGSSTSASNKYNVFEDNLVEGNQSYYVYGFYLYYYNSTTSFNNWQTQRNRMVGNRSYYAFYGLYMYYISSCIVTNNVVAGNRHIGSSTSYTYNYLYNTSPFTSAGMTWEIRNNTWQYDGTTSPVPGSAYAYFYFYPYYIDNVRFTGNIIDYRGGYIHYIYMYNYGSSGAAFSGMKEWDYNDWFVRGFTGTTYWYVNGTNYSDYANVKSLGFLGPNDYFLSPEYRNPAALDYHAKAFQLQDIIKYNSLVPIDHIGTARSTDFNDAGAFEQMPMDLELVSTNFVVPDTVCAGYTIGRTMAIVKNKYLEDSATQFNMSYSINGGPKSLALVTKKIVPGDTARVFFPKDLVLNAVGPTTVVISIDREDDTASNQSFTFTTFVKPAPGGGKFAFSPKPTRTIYQSTKTNDITVLKEPVIYTSAPPRVYSNSNYGLKWVASAWATNKSGTMRPASEITYTKPTLTTDLEVQYKTSDVALEDSLVWIYLKYTDLSNGCDTIVKRQVLIYPTIIPDFTFPAVVCDGDNALFENQSTVRSGSMEFFWDFGTGNVKDNTETPEPYFIFPKSGTFKVKLTAKTLPYGFASFDSAIVTIRPKPTAKFVHTNACEGSAITFNSAGTSGTATLSWDFGDNTSSTAPNPTHTYTKTGAYMVVFKVVENGCTEIINKRVYQFDKPKSKWTLLSGSCDNDQFKFSNTSTIATGTVGSIWNFDDGAVVAEEDPIHQFNSFGMKNVKLVSVSEFGCKDSLVKQVNVKESPKVAFANSTPCSLTPTQFTNQTPSVPGTIASYKWTFSDGGTSLAISPTYLFAGVGPKTVNLAMQLDNGCKANISKNLVVGVQPKANFSAQNVCTGEPVVFENKTDWEQGVISYNWNFGDATFTTERAPRKEYNVGITTTYTVTLVASIEGGCTDEFSQQVTINEGPKGCDFAAETDYANNYFGIKMEAVDAGGLPPNQSGVTYTWVIEGAGNKTGATILQDLKKDGKYEVTMVATVDATGCSCSKTRTIEMNRTSVEQLATQGITMYPNPSNGNFNIALTEGFGNVVNIEIMSNNGAVVKQFSAQNNGLLQVNASDLAEGLYTVRVSSGTRVATSPMVIGR